MGNWISNKLGFGKSVNFWDWMRATYTIAELRTLIHDATDVSLIRTPQFFTNAPTIDEDALRKTITMLMANYGSEIWGICLGAGGQGNDNGPSGLVCLTKLDLAAQVYDSVTLEEFLVRNAMKLAASKILNMG
jgi:hypothetical protein